jgi:hypothetical protein
LPIARLGVNGGRRRRFGWLDAARRKRSDLYALDAARIGVEQAPAPYLCVYTLFGIDEEGDDPEE